MTTAHPTVLSSILLATALSLPQTALGVCTARDRIELRKEGYTKQEVEGICAEESDERSQQHAPRQAPGPAPTGFATVCVTYVGSCYMMQAIPIGSYCSCYTAQGIYPGVAQ